MTPHDRWLLVAALVCMPAMAAAQHKQHSAAPAPAPQRAQHAAPTPSPAPAPEAPDFQDFPNDAVEDEGMWFDDDLLAFGLSDDFFTWTGDLDGLEDAEVEETTGPNGERRIIVREFRGGPGEMGGGQGMGRGMGHGKGMMGMHGRRGGALMRHRMGGAIGMRMARLDLTDAQREKLHALHEAKARKAVQRRADLQLARMDLHKLMRADKPDAGAVNAQIDRMARLRADGAKAAFETRMQARAVLTPEQWKQLHGPPAHPGGMRREMMDTPGGSPRR